jgi:hypothetical protein
MKTPALIVAGLAVLSLSVSACASVEEPDSFSNAGTSTKTSQTDPASKPATETKGEKQAKPAKPKWQRSMNKVKLGMSMSKVKHLVGKPHDTDASETSVPDFDADTLETTERTMTMDTWTYGNMLTDDATWVLSFIDGKLDSKSRI